MSVCSRGHVGGPAAKPLGIEKKTKKKHVVTHTERTSHFTSTVAEMEPQRFFTFTACIRMKLLDFFHYITEMNLKQATAAFQTTHILHIDSPMCTKCYYLKA